MAEYADKSMEEITSEFIVSTCELLPKSYDVVSDRPQQHGWYVIHCGSAMEFYIRPLNPCVTDTDLLIYSTNELVFIKDFPVLPLDVSVLGDTIDCFKIDPYLNYPGFVKIRALGKMNYNWKCKKYEFSPKISPVRYCTMIPYAPDGFIKERFGAISESVRGPASTLHRTPGSPSEDTVKSAWCPQWPEEAQEWPKRRRDHGWPTTDTISEVVQHGCHVVYVQHRDCRDDDLQWRLSFSVAEVILLQSWSQIQQIVYHLLRFFAKTEIIQKDCPKEDEVLCPYHFKTLMLWACEETSPEWWNSSSVLAICCELLKKLGNCLKRRFFPNYFIRRANLLHVHWNPEMLEKIERLLSDYSNCGILCHWFLEKYIQPVIRTDIGGENRQTLLEFRRMVKSKTMDYMFASGQLLRHIPNRYSNNSKRSISREGSKRRVELSRKISAVMLPLPETAWRVTCFDTALFSLDAAHALEYENISWDSELFTEYVKELFFKKNIVKCQFQIFPKPYTAEENQIQFLRALDFMANLTESNSLSKFQLRSLISKECLRKTLGCDNSQSNIIAPAALVYLAALHFASSELQIAIDLCSIVLLDQTTNVENEILNAGCLFFIDDVARIVGFCLTWKNFNENAHYNKREIFLDLRFTPKVFAHYLTVRSTERISKQLELIVDVPTSSLPLDHFFMALTRKKSCALITSGLFRKCTKRCVYRRMDSLTTIASLSVNPLILKEKLIDALIGCALESLKSFYDGIRKDYGIQCNTDDCYLALYLYKCRQYDEVLHLCERILKEPELQSNFEELLLANVLLLPSLACFFDGDVQYLLGFHTLFNFLSPVHDDTIKRLLTDESMSKVGLALFGDFDFNLKRMPCSISFHFSGRYHYIIGRHFLARYLKLKCGIDCNYLFAETMAEFSAMRCYLPLENTIRRFLMQKLGDFK